jgi:hypothetical protein
MKPPNSIQTAKVNAAETPFTEVSKPKLKTLFAK